MAWNLIPLKLPPGIFRNGTNYESKGRWNNANLIRWHQGVMRPVGGWIQGMDDEVLDGICRSGLGWKLNDGGRRMVFATEQKVYVWNGGTLSDITPAGYTEGRVSSAEGFGYGSGPYGRRHDEHEAPAHPVPVGSLYIHVIGSLPNRIGTSRMPKCTANHIRNTIIGTATQGASFTRFVVTLVRAYSLFFPIAYISAMRRGSRMNRYVKAQPMWCLMSTTR